MRGLLVAHRDRELGHGGVAGLARRRPRVLARARGTLVRVLRLSGLIAAGIVVYFGVLWLLGVRAGQFRLQRRAARVGLKRCA